PAGRTTLGDATWASTTPAIGSFSVGPSPDGQVAIPNAVDGSLAIANFPQANADGNVSVSADIDVSQTAFNSGGVVVRSNNGTYYQALVINNGPVGGGTSNSFLLGIHQSNGTFNFLGFSTITQTVGMHNIRLDAYGNKLDVYADGVIQVKATDGTLSSPGGVGIFGGTANVLFADFSATELSPVGLPFTDNFQQPASSSLGSPFSVDAGGFTINGAN